MHRITLAFEILRDLVRILPAKQAVQLCYPDAEVVKHGDTWFVDVEDEELESSDKSADDCWRQARAWCVAGLDRLWMPDYWQLEFDGLSNPHDTKFVIEPVTDTEPAEPWYTLSVRASKAIRLFFIAKMKTMSADAWVTWTMDQDGWEEDLLECLDPKEWLLMFWSFEEAGCFPSDHVREFLDALETEVYGGIVSE